jgi:hypothetical protein
MGVTGKDLRTTATELKMHRYARMDHSPWGLQWSQPFFPPLEKLFKTDTLSSLSEYGIKLGSPMEAIVTDTEVRVKGVPVPAHRKTTMILSPFKWMRGDYGTFGLPKPEGIASDMQERIQSPHTAGYVGALASIALSESACAHFPTVYGVYTGLAARHTVDISDDYEELCDKRWFGDNIGKTFDLKLRSPEAANDFRHTRGQRREVVVGDETLLEGVQDVDADHVSEPGQATAPLTTHGEEEQSVHDEETDDSESEDPFDIRSCDCSPEEEEELNAMDDDGGDDEEPFAWATFTNIPVITTVMETCTGTFYDLIRTHPEPEKHLAWTAQIVMALAYAQRTFGFVHNDLHGNNVMYVPTTEEFLYYKHNGVAYRIPTHGVLIKIIDFDRSIVSLRLIGMKESRMFMSSQFMDDEEAAGQYNAEPFYDNQRPHIPPSSSFDLARFATSIFWDLFPAGPDVHSTHPLFEMFQQWMEQSDGSSVMFREARDDHDRYHGFHLYKAIARYCKNAVPRRQMIKFRMFEVPVVPVGASCLFIES